ncbi:hypothetical protein AXF42_Ash000208 [Apostasia shenzhenica]|uniref:DUF632 domain-containing protein n=1 Tax=Apostasia shenzhenica TaxID=1088818 RepID=A0A2I0AFS0_9ASPA|nr:hypothetical protein AXF42_Ash000208 [Apostasia shenzhenica]
MAIMWEAMYSHHNYQHKLVTALRAFNVSFATWETSEQHHDITIQLWQVVRDWHSKFQGYVTHQKAYVQALNSWLKLNLVPFENNSLKERGSSPPRPVKPPIRDLLHYWHEQLEKLPDAIASRAIYCFSEVVSTILILQEDELKLKEKCEETRSEFIRKKRAYEDWHHKYMERRMASTSAQGTDQDHEKAADHKDHAEVRKHFVESIKMRLKSEEEEYQRICRQVRDKSIGSFKNHLPEVFSALSNFSLACSDMYKQLSLITQKPALTGQSPSR